MGIGCVIVYAQDLSDILGHLTKILACMPYENLTGIVFVAMVLLWIWTRNFFVTYLTALIWSKIWENGGARDPLYPEMDTVA